MKQLYTNRTGDKTYVWRKFACFHNSIDFFGQAMLLTCRIHVRLKEETDRIWSILLQRMVRLGHVRVGIKHMCDRFLKAVIMYSWKIYTSCPFEL